MIYFGKIKKIRKKYKYSDFLYFDMINMDEVTVGKKGGIFPKKKIRNIAGISPGDRVLISASSNQLIIKKILSIDEIFELPIIATATPSKIESELEEEGNSQRERSTNDT